MQFQPAGELAVQADVFYTAFETNTSRDGISLQGSHNYALANPVLSNGNYAVGGQFYDSTNIYVVSGDTSDDDEVFSAGLNVAWVENRWSVAFDLARSTSSGYEADGYHYANVYPGDGSLVVARLGTRAGLRSHRFRFVDGRIGAAVGGLPPPPSGGWRWRRVRVHHLPIRGGATVVSGRVLVGGTGQASKVGVHRVPATEGTRGVRRIAHRRLPQSAERSAIVPEANHPDAVPLDRMRSLVKAASADPGYTVAGSATVADHGHRLDFLRAAHVPMTLNRGKKLRFKARGLRQPCGDSRPRLR